MELKGAFARILRSIEDFLHKNEIEPAIKFPTNLFQMAGFDKAQLPMKMD